MRIRYLELIQFEEFISDSLKINSGEETNVNKKVSIDEKNQITTSLTPRIDRVYI